MKHNRSEQVGDGQRRNERLGEDEGKKINQELRAHYRIISEASRHS
jgi:hypothetical protein